MGKVQLVDQVADARFGPRQRRQDAQAVPVAEELERLHRLIDCRFIADS